MLKVKKIAIAVLGAVVLCLYLFASDMDYEDKAIAAMQYCQGVESGEHPDYNESYDKDCK